MRKIFPLILILLSFTNCSKNDEETSNPIVGEWKLMKIEQIFRNPNNYSTDYSNQNIIFKFDNNSNLNINNDNTAFASGNYKYEYKNDFLSASPSPGETKTPIIVIDNQKWTCELINGKMKLGISYVDGPDLYLEKR